MILLACAHWCLGIYEGAYLVASESCALDIIGAEYLRDVEPGEFIVVDEDGIRSEIVMRKEKVAHCIFEYVYFSRPGQQDILETTSTKHAENLESNWPSSSPAEADIVISVPDSSNTTALGYSQRTNMKYEIGLIRNHYVGRTFIHPAQTKREASVLK